MGDGGHAVALPDVPGDLQGVFAGAAAGAVGDADEGGLQGGDGLRGGLDACKGAGGLGGEHLKGQGQGVPL